MLKARVEVPLDNYGRLYIGLLETDASSAAKLAYGVMWSFGGGGCWASVQSIARRMSVSPNTARAAIAELEALGWLELKDAPSGGAKVWQVKTAPLQPLKGGASTIGGGPLQPLEPKQERKQDAKQDLSPADAGALELTPPVTAPKGKPSTKAPWAAADGTGWQALVDAYAEAYAAAKGQPGLKPELTPADFSQLKRLASGKGFTLADYKARLARMGAHAFHARMEFRLAYFCTNYREFAEGSGALGGRGGRYMAVDKTEDFNG